VMLLTDAQGRIYRLEPSRQAALVAQTNEGDATRLVDSPGGLLAATGNLAKVLRLGTTPRLLPAGSNRLYMIPRPWPDGAA